MNEFATLLGIESWKPVLTAFALPPLPLLLLALFGARLLAVGRRGIGWFAVLVGVLGVWLGSTAAVGEWLATEVLRAPPPLSVEQRARLAAMVKARQPVAIVVLGGGRETRAPEYGTPNLTPLSLARLRYGLWLARETGAPVAFSGGVGWAQGDEGASEARIAAVIAERDFNRPLRWVEEASRDTRENAARTMALLRRDGIREVVLVSHGWHLPRAQRAFVEASRGEATILPAPMGMASTVERPVLRWLPSHEGFLLVRLVLRETLGRLAGA